MKATTKNKASKVAIQFMLDRAKRRREKAK